MRHQNLQYMSSSLTVRRQILQYTINPQYTLNPTDYTSIKLYVIESYIVEFDDVYGKVLVTYTVGFGDVFCWV